MTENLFLSLLTVSGVVMADGVDGGIADFRSWKSVATIYFQELDKTAYRADEGKELTDKQKKARMIKYWLSLKNGGLVECYSPEDLFWGTLDNSAVSVGSQSTDGFKIIDSVPVVRVRQKPFLPSGVQLRQELIKQEVLN